MYNNNTYNVSVYNADTLKVGLSENMSSADVITGKELDLLKLEAQPLLDNMLRFFNQVDEMALDFFTPTDTAQIEFNKGVVDTVATTDSAVVVSFVKVLLESMSPADAATFVYSTAKTEAIVSVDVVTKQITDKRFTESLRLQDWVRLHRTGDQWGN